MGVFSCTKHGRQGMTLVCGHLAERVKVNVKSPDGDADPPLTREVMFSVRSLSCGEVVGTMWLCFDCQEEQRAPREMGIDDEVGGEAYDRFEEAVGLVPVCGQCFEERCW